jgi:hypothetical protein
MKKLESHLRKLWRRVPFRPFVVELVSGTKVTVTHPEAMTVHRGRGVYIDRDGGVWVFDEDSVARVTENAHDGVQRRRRRPR